MTGTSIHSSETTSVVSAVSIVPRKPWLALSSTDIDADAALEAPQLPVPILQYSVYLVRIVSFHFCKKLFRVRLSYDDSDIPSVRTYRYVLSSSFILAH